MESCDFYDSTSEKELGMKKEDFVDQESLPGLELDSKQIADGEN